MPVLAFTLVPGGNPQRGSVIPGIHIGGGTGRDCDKLHVQISKERLD
jgi:hypothetical protein